MQVLKHQLRLGAEQLIGPLTFVGLIAFGVIGNRQLIFHPIFEWGDTAANAILIERARNLRLVFGNYSRFGFNHPGPAFLYVQGLGERLFQVLPGIHTPLNADLVSVIVLNAAFLAVTVHILNRNEGTLTALLFLLAMGVQIRFTHGLLASSWMPHLYLPPFALFVVSLAMVVAKRNALSPLAISTAFLIHGHVSFILIAGFPFVAILLIRRRSIATWLRLRRTRVTCLTTFVLFLTPLVINTIVNGISFWTAYVTKRSDIPVVPRTVGDSAVFVGRFWRFAAVPSLFGVVVVTVLIASGLAGSLLRTPRGGSAWIVTCAAMVTMSMVYAYFGIDDLRFDYTGIFIGALAAISTAIATGVALRAMATNHVVTSMVRRVGTMVPAAVTTLVATAVAIVGIVAVSYRPSVNPDHGAPWIPAATQVVTSAVRPTGTVRLSFAGAAWPDSLGLLIALQRDHRAACVDDPNWTFLVTRAQICGKRDGPTVRLMTEDIPAGTTALYTTPSGVHMYVSNP